VTDHLSVEDLVAVAFRAVGPDAQVRDWGLLASAAARPQASAFGEDAYPDLVDKAAALLVSLVHNHPLVDGNKRLGWAATVVFLALNDLDLDPQDADAAFALVMAVADGSLGDELTKVSDVLRPWLR
jgi:death-on-curing protein